MVCAGHTWWLLDLLHPRVHYCGKEDWLAWNCRSRGGGPVLTAAKADVGEDKVIIQRTHKAATRRSAHYMCVVMRVPGALNFGSGHRHLKLAIRYATRGVD